MGYRPVSYSHIVVGAGAVGASSAYHLSNDQGRTLVLERFEENHAFGSSHGRTRILRTAYAEGSSYVPLVLRARNLWNGLGEAAGVEIFRPTGAILAGRSDSIPLSQARASARHWKLPHEVMDSDASRRRFPAFRFGTGDRVLWDPKGGVLFPERAISAFRRIAHDRGVVFRWNSPVTGWEPRSDGRILVRTASREYLTDKLVLSAGAWMSSLVRNLRLPLIVEQQTVYWFRPGEGRPESFRGMPAFVWYVPQGGYYYGLPDVGDGVKIGGNRGQIVRNLNRRPPSAARELRSIRAFRARRLPGLASNPDRHVTCLYTNTPDKNFIVDFHPDSHSVVVVSACSGHGFKFASVMGELVARGVTTGKLSSLLAPFRLRN
ncbi:MAG: N-methyl-L-tryptophan oxidase [Thermoplasmata archaeon]